MNDITGTLVIPLGTAAFTASCIVLVRDITHSDAPVATPVAIEKRDIAYNPGDPPPSFGVTGIPDADLAAVEAGTKALNLEIHVDLDGSGAFSSGDLATVQGITVRRATTHAPIVVELTRI